MYFMKSSLILDVVFGSALFFYINESGVFVMENFRSNGTDMV